MDWQWWRQVNSWDDIRELKDLETDLKRRSDFAGSFGRISEKIMSKGRHILGDGGCRDGVTASYVILATLGSLKNVLMS